jgi:catalase
MSTCRKEDTIKRQIAIFREVSPDIAKRLEKATGIKGYDGIKNMTFNGTHNGMAEDKTLRNANGMKGEIGMSWTEYNGAPFKGTHKEDVMHMDGVDGHSNGVKAQL